MDAAMTDAPRTGPPEKRERRPGQETATLGKTGKGNSSDNATNSVVLSPAISAPQWPMSPAQLERWGEHAGIPVVPITRFHLEKLVAGGEPAWIAGDCWCCDDEELAFALAHATQVIIADDVDRFNHVAAGLALEGERVLLLDWPEGTPLPLRGGNRGERHVE
jgi:hypothetical protein